MRSEWLLSEDPDPRIVEVGEWLFDIDRDMLLLLKWLELKKEFWPINVLLLFEATPVKKSKF